MKKALAATLASAAVAALARYRPIELDLEARREPTDDPERPVTTIDGLLRLGPATIRFTFKTQRLQ